MATLLDIGLLSFFNSVFVWLLIFSVVFAMLQKFKVFGGALVINAAIAAALAFLSVIVEEVVLFINFVAPWFIVFFIFLMLLTLSIMLLGARESDFTSVITSTAHSRSIIWPIIGVGLVIILAGLGNTFGQSFLEAGQGIDDTDTGDTNDFQDNVYDVLFHPAVAGLVLLMTIAIFSVALLTNEF